MLDESRFNRRLHQLGGILIEIFEFIASYFKEISCEMEYIIDSFPVEVCKNIRINRSKIVKGKQWRGYTASIRTYLYSIKVQLITTKTGIPISFHFTCRHSHILLILFLNCLLWTDFQTSLQSFEAFAR